MVYALKLTNEEIYDISELIEREKSFKVIDIYGNIRKLKNVI